MMQPLEAYKTGFDLPKIFTVKTKVSFNSASNPALVTTNDLTEFGAILLNVSQSSYNCPSHCQYCSADYYPNGKCLGCETVQKLLQELCSSRCNFLQLFEVRRNGGERHKYNTNSR